MSAERDDLNSILIAVHTNTFFVELFRFAQFVAARRTYRPVFILYPYPTAPIDAALLASVGIECFSSEGKAFCQDSSTELKHQARRVRCQMAITSRIVARIAGLFGRYVVADILKHILEFSLRSRQITRKIKAHKPRAIVLGGDMTGYDTALYIKVGHRHHVPSMVIPSTMSNGLEQAEVYFADPQYHVSNWSSRLCFNIFPKWGITHKGRRLLREKPARILSMEFFGVAPPLPWIFNSGFVDVVALESQAMRRYYMDTGLPAEKMLVTGSPADDVMAMALKQKGKLRTALLQRLGLDRLKPIMLVAFPPDFLSISGGRSQCDFGSYADLVRFWMNALYTVESYNVVICLHPSVDRNTMTYLERAGLRIADQTTASLVPLADIYVASVSSTIRWAIACGIPVINYDVYRYRYTDYIGLSGVLTMEAQEEFLEVLGKMTSDRCFLDKIKAHQRLDSPSWGNLDGKSSQRILDVLIQLDQQWRTSANYEH